MSKTLILLTFLLVASMEGGAVCLQPPIRICNEFMKSDAVFVAEVIDDNAGVRSKEVDGWSFRMKVIKVFSGKLAEKIIVYTPADTGRLILTKGKTYLLFAENTGGRLWIGACGNSSEVKKEKVMETENVLKDMQIGRTCGIKGHLALKKDGYINFDKGVSNVLFTANQIGGDKKYPATSDKHGWFHFMIPPGTYEITTNEKGWEIEAYDLSCDNPSKVTVVFGGGGDVEFVAQKRVGK